MQMSSMYRSEGIQLDFLSLLAAGLRPTGLPQGIKNPLWKGLAGRLRQLGIDHAISQTQMARFSGVGNVSRIELGRIAPGIDTIEKLATALGVSAVWLAFGDQGHLRFRQRYPRPALPYDPPTPELAERPFKALHLGLAERLKSARQIRSLSLRQVGKLAKHPHAPEDDKGLSAQAVLDMETGRRIPYVETCEAVAVALDVSPGWLAFGEGEGPDGG